MASSASNECSKQNDKFLNAVREKNYQLVRNYLFNSKTNILSVTDWVIFVRILLFLMNDPLLMSSLFLYNLKTGHTALHLASMNGDVEIAKLLVRQQANVNAISNSKKTPLHLASEYGHTLIVDLLIIWGSNVNAQDILKMTPLHWYI
jgi:ankyrin repeat protein